jgi:hypothetical protein
MLALARCSGLLLPVDRATAAAMADDPANGDAPQASGEVKSGSWPAVRRTLVWSVAFLVPCAVIALSVFFIVKGGAPHALPTTIASSVVPANDAGVAGLVPSAAVDGGTALLDAPALDKAQVAAPLSEDEGSDEEPVPVKHSAPKHFATVQQAAAGSCSTESVDGLSRQIIEQARCIKPNDFVALPRRANLVMAPHVFPYLELAARDHLVRALESHSDAKMTINSCLRTVAQQYLVSRWAVSKSCGVQLATLPGESNHEIGTALDIAEAAKWRPALEAQEFHWLGTSDRVHFDYKGGSSAPRTATDVLAFQKLWNRNHHDDAIPEDGHYNATTEQRLKKSPPGGFPLGSSCGKVGALKH